MKDQSDINIRNVRIKKSFIGWLFFPISLFPLAALLTYDSASMTQVQIPAAPSMNWIGPIGDSFAYYGYSILGLAVWILPVYCIIIGFRSVSGATLRPGLRAVWRTTLLVSTACLIEIIAPSAPRIQELQEFINIENAGGATGYLVATKLLIPVFGHIGTSVLMQILLVVSLVGAIGPGNIAAFFKFLYRWALGKQDEFDPGDAAPGTPEYNEAQALFENARKAREAAKQQKEDEKQRIKAEKEEARRRKEDERRQKEAERVERERQRQEDMLAKAEAARAARNAARDPQSAPQPIAKKAQPAPAPAEDDKGPYILPSVNLLAPLQKATADHSDVHGMSQKLIDTLKLFGVDATMSYTVQGPVVTKYAIMLAPGTRYSSVTNIADNLKGALHAKSLRIEAPIPGEECIGIEVPNKKPVGISFREIFESDAWRNNTAELPLLFGKDAAGKELVADLASMPHMLVAGATGQGKSVCLNSLINGLLMTRTPEQLKLIMVDPKSVEFTPYSSIPHLLVPVITDNRKVIYSLHWAVAEMEKRLKIFSRARVRNIYDFNHRKQFTQTDMFGNDSEINSDMPRTVPYIVIIIDEVADLMSACAREVTPDISRLTAKARAAGIHLILATQRPDAKVITGTIKANIPGRVAFKTSQAIDSRTILDDSGAENLIGRGDMLFKGKDGLLIRAQGAWISDQEIANITAFIEEHANTQFDETFATKLGRVKEASIDDPFADNEDDPDNQPKPKAEEKAAQRELVKAAANADDFKKAVECLINTKRASVSHFQRQMGWGYNHAAKILDMLTAKNIVSPQQGMGARQIIMDEDQLIKILNGEDIAEDASGGEDTGADVPGETPAEDDFTEEQI